MMIKILKKYLIYKIMNKNTKVNFTEKNPIKIKMKKMLKQSSKSQQIKKNNKLKNNQKKKMIQICFYNLINLNKN